MRAHTDRSPAYNVHTVDSTAYLDFRSAQYFCVLFVFSWPAENMLRSHESSETACDLVFYSGAWRTCVCVVSIAIELTTFAFHRMPFHVILFCFIKRFYSGANAECLFRANFLFGFIRLFVFVHVLLMVAKHRGRSKNTIFTLLDVCFRRRR